MANREVVLAFYVGVQERSLVVRCEQPGDRPLSLDGFELVTVIPASIVEELDEAEAERRVGSAVLMIVDAFQEDNARIGTYKLQIESALRRVSDILSEKAERNDADAQYTLALKFLSDSARLDDESLLDTAGEWLEKAASNKHVKAVEFLKTWSRTKELQRRFIKSNDG